MAQTADTVAVELEARMQGFTSNVNAAATGFDASMDKITASAGKAEKVVTQTSARMGNAFGNAGQRSRQLGIQIGQLGSSLGSGMNPMLVLSQQASDFAYVLGGTEGAAGKLANFFSGPWGAALLAASLVVGTLVTRHKEETASLDSLLEKMREHYRQAQLNDQADRIWQRTIEGLTEAIDKRTEAQAKANETDRHSLQAGIRGAQTELTETLKRQREETEALAAAQQRLGEARATFNRAERSPDADASSVGAALAEVVKAERAFVDASTRLGQTNAKIEEARANVRGAQGDLAQFNATVMTDAQKRINDLYDNLERNARLAARGNDQLTEALEGTLRGYEKARKAALDTAEAQERQAKAAARAGQGQEQIARFIMPVEGPVTSGFGPRRPPTAGASSFHPAIDIGAPMGTPVHAAAGGVVVTAGRMGGLGNVVIVDHGGGTITEYGHLSAIIAKRGQTVGQGDVIGNVGSTGISTGPHLDYRVRVGGKYVDPRKGTFPVDEVAAGQRGIQAQQQAAAEGERAARRQAAYEAELAQLEQQLLGATRPRLATAQQQLEYGEQAVIAERDRNNATYAAAAATGQIGELEAAILTAKNNELATAKTMRLYADEAARKSQMSLQLDAQYQQAQVDQLQYEASTAKTGDERRAAALRLLDAEIALERIKLQQVIDATAAGTAEHELAVLRMQQLGQERQRRVQAANDNPQNMSPGQAYRYQLQQTAAHIDDAMEQITVDGLQKMNDEITGAIMGTESLGEAFDNVADQIIQALIKIGIQQAIIKPIADLLFGPGAGGGAAAGNGLVSAAGTTGGGWLSQLISSLFTHRAGGGPLKAGQAAIVGESGEELFVPQQPGTIIPNADTVRMMQGGGGSSVHVGLTVNAPGATAETVAMIRRELASAAPTLVAAAQRATVKQLTRTRT